MVTKILINVKKKSRSKWLLLRLFWLFCTCEATLPLPWLILALLWFLWTVRLPFVKEGRKTTCHSSRAGVPVVVETRNGFKMLWNAINMIKVWFELNSVKNFFVRRPNFGCCIFLFPLCELPTLWNSFEWDSISSKQLKIFLDIPLDIFWMLVNFGQGPIVNEK